MRRGYLSEYFEGIAAKTLSAVEADTVRSNQHEFNGVESLKKLFGRGSTRVEFPARFVYLDDTDDEPVAEAGFVTWYDARARSAGKTGRSEHRLYFPTTRASQCVSEGDLLVLGKRQDGRVLAVIAPGGSTTANQLRWLFGLDDVSHPGFSVRAKLESERDRIGFASRLILEEIGVQIELHADTYLETLLKKFEGKFPTTRVFSAYTRETLPEASALREPDAALMAFMEREEILFRTLERYLLAGRLAEGFVGKDGADVDGFVSYSLSVQNRRKSRVGFALENHLEFVLSQQGIRYVRATVTERGCKPDFLFPGAREYHDTAFPTEKLAMLASKSTCKDRWRQILSEADRIETKHLLTLETSISENQTREMDAQKVRLVVPASLHQTFNQQQQAWLLDVAEFVALVKRRQG